MVDGEVGLKIYTLSLVKSLGYIEDVVDTKKKVMIKAYDDEERSSRGVVILPIRVGPIVKEIIC